MARRKAVLTKKEMQLKKEERNARLRAYREEHKDEINAKRRAKYAEKKKALQSEDKKLEEKKAKQKENYKRWYNKNKEKIAAERKAKREENKELLKNVNITAGVVEEVYTGDTKDWLRYNEGKDFTEKEIMDIRKTEPAFEDKSFLLDTTYLHFDLISRTVSPEVFKEIVIGLKHLEEANRLMKTQRPEDAEVFAISCPELRYLVKKN